MVWYLFFHAGCGMENNMMDDGLHINEAGTKYWYLNGLLHREGGPAVEFTSGDKFYYFHGKRHREDGPAIEGAAGSKRWYWYYHGEYIQCTSQQEFERLIKIKAFW